MRNGPSVGLDLHQAEAAAALARIDVHQGVGAAGETASCCAILRSTEICDEPDVSFKRVIVNPNDSRSILALAALKRLGAPEAHETAGSIAAASGESEMEALLACLRSLAPKRKIRMTLPARRGRASK